MTGVLIVRQPHTEKELEAMYDLRWRVLRKPWNQPRGSERDDKEEEAMKFIAVLNDQVIGTARFHNITDRIGQIRYLAVDELFQNKKIGTNLLSSIHMTARNKRFKYIILNARESAVGFFKKLGYSVVEPGPLLFGSIKHFKMKKRL
ncbi:MAG: GNAT family N-acetyltransferase [Candidatus Lokiarchaeota archaeon]|nr:GNAT family N-acetyltransferase [Candidatus Lokiarchaeota archaeon]